MGKMLALHATNPGPIPGTGTEYGIWGSTRSYPLLGIPPTHFKKTNKKKTTAGPALWFLRTSTVAGEGSAVGGLKEQVDDPDSILFKQAPKGQKRAIYQVSQMSVFSRSGSHGQYIEAKFHQQALFFHLVNFPQPVD